MTNEFAIKVLKELRGYGDKFANIGYDRKEALDMANQALEFMDKLNKRDIERFNEMEYTNGYNKGWKDGRKALEQDWYDVPSGEMTLEQVRQAVKDLRKKLAEYLEQQPCEDCISRQYLIERATSWDKHFADSERCVSLTEIQNAPSVTPNARWIPCSDKMPDINIHVLAQFVMGGMAECYYAHNWWHIVGGFRISGDEVIAWQPLPELYKAESEE